MKANKQTPGVGKYLKYRAAKNSEPAIIPQQPLCGSAKPSPKCYSIGCPAIWHDKCTSTMYGKCGVRDSE